MIYSPIEAHLKAIKASQTTANDPWNVIKKSAGKALQGGIAGAGAMVVQVSTLMWMRTVMNYQYRHGTTTMHAIRTLYAQGGGGLHGVLRFYKGFLPALLQGPLSRFGDTAANAGMLAFLDSYPSTKSLSVEVKTVAASGAAALFRMFLMPIDCLKTTLQVEGKNGIPLLMNKIKTNGIGVLWYGAVATATATFVGHYPWFYTNNKMTQLLPPPAEFMPFIGNPFVQKLCRNALIGFCSSAVSDTISNSIRVIKTVRQTSAEKISMLECAKMVIKKDGLAGLFGRGLSTRIVTNGLQGLMFNIMWRAGQDYLDKKEKEKERTAAAAADAAQTSHEGRG